MRQQQTEPFYVRVARELDAQERRRFWSALLWALVGGLTFVALAWTMWLVTP